MKLRSSSSFRRHRWSQIYSILFLLEVFEGIASVGAISGAALNLTFMRRIDNTARRGFQERWLRDNEKVRSTPAAPVHSRDLAVGWMGAMRRAVYSGCHAAGFGTILPLYLLASLFEDAETPFHRAFETAPTTLITALVAC